MNKNTPTHEDEIVFDLVLRAVGLSDELVPVLAWWWQQYAKPGQGMKAFLLEQEVLNRQACADIQLVLDGHVPPDRVKLFLTEENVATLLEQIQRADIQMSAIYIHWDSAEDEAAREKQEHWDEFKTGEFIDFGAGSDDDPGAAFGAGEFITMQTDQTPELGRVMLFEEPDLHSVTAASDDRFDELETAPASHADYILSAADDLLDALAAS